MCRLILNSMAAILVSMVSLSSHAQAPTRDHMIARVLFFVADSSCNPITDSTPRTTPLREARACQPIVAPTGIR